VYSQPPDPVAGQPARQPALPGEAAAEGLFRHNRANHCTSYFPTGAE
jgi:hypothetical protein